MGLQKCTLYAGIEFLSVLSYLTCMPSLPAYLETTPDHSLHFKSLDLTSMLYFSFSFSFPFLFLSSSPRYLSSSEISTTFVLPCEEELISALYAHYTVFTTAALSAIIHQTHNGRRRRTNCWSYRRGTRRSARSS